MKSHSVEKDHYRVFGTMVALHFIAMYILMYAMVHNIGENVYNSMNQVYMALLMTSSMIAIESPLMRSMYPKKEKNAVLIIVAALLLAGSYTAIRRQVLIGDKQFVRSMIPHHSGAILMCKEAPIQDQELKSLCSEIVTSQQAEINQMKAILKRLDAQ